MKKIISITMVISMFFSLLAISASAAEWKTGNIVGNGSYCGYTTVYLTANKDAKIKVYAYNASGKQVSTSSSLEITVKNESGKTIKTYNNAKNGDTITLSKGNTAYRVYVKLTLTETYRPETRFNKNKIIKTWGMKTVSNATFNYNNSYAKKLADEKKKQSTQSQSGKNTSSAKPVLYEGTAYFISPKHTGTRCVIDTNGGNSSKNEGANAVLWQYGNGNYNSRKYKVYYVGNGYYKIVNANSGLVLDVNTSNLNVAHYKYHGGSNQLWRFDDAGDGYVYIISKWSKNGKKYCLDVHGLYSGNGTNIEVCDINYGNNQRFKFWK